MFSWALIQAQCKVFTDFYGHLCLLILSYYSAHVFKKHALFKFEYVLCSPKGLIIQWRLPLASRLEKSVNCGDLAGSDLEVLQGKRPQSTREECSKINTRKVCSDKLKKCVEFVFPGEA